MNLEDSFFSQYVLADFCSVFSVICMRPVGPQMNESTQTYDANENVLLVPTPDSPFGHCLLIDSQDDALMNGGVTKSNDLCIRILNYSWIVFNQG